MSVLRWAQTFPAPSDIPSYVQNLHVSCVSLLDDISDVTLDLSTFSRLKGLFIGGSEVTPARYRRLNGNCFQRITLLPSANLRTFSLSFPVIPAPDVFSVVRHFPHLDNLYLKCFAVLPSGSAVETETEVSPSFRGTLTIASHLNYGPLVTNLLAFRGGIHFSHLKIAVLRDDELPNLRELVDMCSHTITSLYVTIDLGKSIPLPSYLLEHQIICSFPDLTPPTLPDNEFSYLFDLSKLHNLSELHVTLHAMRFPATPFIRMLSSIAGAESRLRNLTLSLFTWRSWRFTEPDVERWDAVDIALVELFQPIKERVKTDPVIQVIVNLLEYGPHDIRDILPRLGQRGLVQLTRDDDSILELSTK